MNCEQLNHRPARRWQSWAVLALGLAVLPALVQAQGFQQRFSAPVADDSPDARLQATGAALAQAVRRLTGRPVALPAAMRAGASDYVSAYRYRWDTSSAQRLLEVDFDLNRLRQALPLHGLSAWDGRRPEVLLWVAVDDGNGRRWLEPTRDGDWLDAIKARAAELGLPLLLPLNDLDDRLALPVDALWHPTRAQVMGAAQRYGAQTVLVGRLMAQGPERWQGRWRLYSTPAAQWDSAARSPKRLLVTGIDTAAEALALAAAPAVAAPVAESVQLDVAGVASVRDYALVNRLLNGLKIVRRAATRYSQGERLRLDVALTGGRLAFEEALRIDGSLQPAPASDAGELNVLWYRVKH